MILNKRPKHYQLEPNQAPGYPSARSPCVLNTHHLNYSPSLHLRSGQSQIIKPPIPIHSPTTPPTIQLPPKLALTLPAPLPAACVAAVLVLTVVLVAVAVAVGPPPPACRDVFTLTLAWLAWLLAALVLEGKGLRLVAAAGVGNVSVEESLMKLEYAAAEFVS